MTNKVISRKTNKRLNIFGPGGEVLNKMNTQSREAFNNAIDMGEGSVQALGALGAGITGIVQSASDNAKIADTSGLEQQIENQAQYKVKASDNASLLDEWGNSSIIGNKTYEDIRGASGGQVAGNMGMAGLQGAQMGMQIGGPWGALVGAAIGGISAGIGAGVGRSKALKKQKEINNNIEMANKAKNQSFINAAENIDATNTLNTLANFSAYGGLLNTYAEGGNMTHGGNFNNNVTFINNGGNHESNPNDGVQYGMDNEGIPNLVEEGEVIYNDYVYSNRLYPDKKVLNKYNLPTKYSNYTFAYIAEKLNKESSERPNDVISKNGLKDSLNRLKNAQEEVREQKENIKMNKAKTAYSKGGKINTFSNIYSYGTKSLQTQAAETQPQAAGTNNESSSVTPGITDEEIRGGIDMPINWSSLLRFTPALASGINVLTDLTGATNTPNYDNLNILKNNINNLPSVKYNPISNYLTYKPIDRNYYTNKLESLAGSTRRAISNLSGGNRATAMANLLAADYNTQNQLGDFAIKSEQYNNDLRNKVSEFNRETNLTNSQLALKAAEINQAYDNLRLKGISDYVTARENLDMAAAQNRATNLNNFYDALTSIGKEEFSRSLANSDPKNDKYIDIFGRERNKQDKVKRRKEREKRRKEKQSKENRNTDYILNSLKSDKDIQLS